MDYKITEVTFSCREDTENNTTSSKVISVLYAHILYKINNEYGEIYAPLQTIAEKEIDSDGYVTSIKTYNFKYNSKDELMQDIETLTDKVVESNNKKVLYDTYVKSLVSNICNKYSIFDRDNKSGLDLLQNVI